MLYDTRERHLLAHEMKFRNIIKKPKNRENDRERERERMSKENLNSEFFYANVFIQRRPSKSARLGGFLKKKI